MDSQTIARVREKLEDAVKGQNNERVFEALGELASLLPNALASPYAALLGPDHASPGETGRDAPFVMAPARTLGPIEPGFAASEAATGGVTLSMAPRRTQQSVGTILRHDPATGADSTSGGWTGFETLGSGPAVAAGASRADKLALVGPLLLRWIGDGLERMVEERLRFQAGVQSARANAEGRAASGELGGIGDVLDGWATRLS